jgi:4-amino-4-deoxy-L-arabinose transferase-like glycosyltransferase
LLRNETEARRTFIAAWCAVLAVKCVLAMHLPLFVDEAFYWQEGMHPAWAYSDLPGLTAWLTRIGVALFGRDALGLRIPFLLLAAAVPWLVARVTAREFGATAGWQAALFALLLPLAGTLGLLAVPDAAMAVATLLCMDACARLLRNVSAGAAVELAAGLALGAFSHYRFIAVIAVGFLVLLLMPEGRRALRDPRMWIAIAFGAAAWTPLVAWNMDNAEAGLRFQLVDRHPWAFHIDGIQFLLVQSLLVTPLLLLAMAVAAWRFARDPRPAPRFFALLGGLVVLGFFALGFFADTERVSFHWPLQGFIALLPLLPSLLNRWPRWLRFATGTLATVGLVLMLGYYAAVSMPRLRETTATTRWYPGNFAGWQKLATQTRRLLHGMPKGTRIVADDFKIGAELGFALGNPRIAVLPHPLNRKHGRAPQLGLWGLREERVDRSRHPVLLVVGASEVQLRELPARYHELCERVGPLPAPRTISIDHGRQRFLLFALPRLKKAGPGKGDCTTPSIAWIQQPAINDKVGRRFEVSGWAFKDGIGLRAIWVTVDGRRVARAEYGLPSIGPKMIWPFSNDPQHPNIGYRAQVDLEDMPKGRHWLGLWLIGRDGSVEPWSEVPFDLE